MTSPQDLIIYLLIPPLYFLLFMFMLFPLDLFCAHSIPHHLTHVSSATDYKFRNILFQCSVCMRNIYVNIVPWVFLFVFWLDLLLRYLAKHQPREPEQDHSDDRPEWVGWYGAVCMFLLPAMHLLLIGTSLTPGRWYRRFSLCHAFPWLERMCWVHMAFGEDCRGRRGAADLRAGVKAEARARVVVLDERV